MIHNSPPSNERTYYRSTRYGKKYHSERSCPRLSKTDDEHIKSFNPDSGLWRPDAEPCEHCAAKPPLRIPDSELENVMHMLNERGLTYRDIGDHYDVSYQTVVVAVNRALEAGHGVETPHDA